MKPSRLRGAGARFVPNQSFNVRRRKGARRAPWIFGGAPVTLPYVFAPTPQAEPAVPDAVPDTADAPEPAAAAPDADAAAPTDSETYAQRKIPKRPPKLRTVSGFSTGLLLPAPDVAWQKHVITSYRPPLPDEGGLYIVMQGTQPIYVGEAGNFKTRWHKRLLEAYESGLIGPTFPDRPITVWLGTMHPLPGDTDRRMLESALIRTFINGNIGGPLRNSTQFNPFKPTKDLHVNHACPPGINTLIVPDKSPVGPAANAVVKRLRADNVLHVPAGTVFEIG